MVDPQTDDQMQDARAWNVLTTPWLEVLDHRGHLLTVSPLKALETAADLHRIVAANPLDLFSAHRFLLTLLYWQAKAGGGVTETRNSLLSGIAPEAVVEAVREESKAFNLFDPKKPFLQDPTAITAKKSSAAYLFAEMASGTNVAHFHHGDDNASRLCLRCALLGLLRLVPWSQSGGAGIAPSVHGAPPIMPLAVGKNLCETLGLNLLELPTKQGKPQWTGQFTPTGIGRTVPLMEGLTWNPRRVHLLEPLAPSSCSRCGSISLPTVGPIVFEKNPACKKPEDGEWEWRDPAAFYTMRDGVQIKTIKTGREAAATVGDDLRGLFVQTFGKKTEPAPESLVVLANAGHADWLVVLPCTNPAHNKSYDHRLVQCSGFGGAAPSRATGWDVTTRCLVGSATESPVIRDLPTTPSRGHLAFVRAAATLTSGTWAVMAEAAERSMEEHPAAFDVFTSIYWPLRIHHASLPGRQAAWMALKLMASAGKHRPGFQVLGGPSMQPWTSIQVNQPEGRTDQGPIVSYPRKIPSGRLLEQELRCIIRKSAAKHSERGIDWPGLCQFLHAALQQ